MKFLGTLFAALSLILSPVVYGERGCPPAEDVGPCICRYGPHQSSLECSGINDDEVLRGIFQRSKGYFYDEVHIMFSSLKYLPEEMFDDATVDELFIQNSTLNALFDSPPDGLQLLYKLHLENTQIKEISHWELIEPLTGLRLLSIYYNLIESIDSTFVKYVPKDITQLTLYATGTKEITPGAFVKFTKLNKIAIDACRLKQLSRNLFPVPFNVKDLYFNENELSVIPDDLFTNMPDLRTVGLRNNYLKTIPESAFDGNSGNLNYIMINDNPLKCDCSLVWLIKNKPKDLSGTCATPIRLHDRQLKDLLPSDFKC